MNRRDFLSTALAAAAASLMPRTAKASDGLVEVLINEPIGEISPDLHGHFVEQLGGVTYDGIWVGENSKVPNIGGIRKALVEKMQQLKAPVVRWPGGCFADSYNWRDGIGPRNKRPVHTNFWANTPQLWKAPDGPQKYEPNEFGTPEFMRFCQLCGAKPYLAANLRSLPALDFYQWVEYCNSPAGSTTLAEMRAADGSKDPYNVMFWGVGNEAWGCGGEFKPEEYAEEFRRYIAWVPQFGQGAAPFGPRLHYIGSGPNGANYEWTRGFFDKMTGTGPRGPLNQMYGWALHYYCGTSGKGDAIDFTTDDWYELLAKAVVMDSLINGHWQVMGEFDKAHKVKLVVDEWGAWHRSTPIAPSYIFSYFPTMRDALVTGLTFDIFNRHADKLAMCNDAQLINTIHQLFVAFEDRFTVTPIFHVFDMYQAHQGGQSLRLVTDAPELSSASGKKVPGLAGSASLRAKTLVVTVVNSHVSEARSAEVSLRGGSAKSCRVTVLAEPDIHAHNDFDHPDAVTPREEQASVSGSTFSWTFKPASVTKLEIELA